MFCRQLRDLKISRYGHLGDNRPSIGHSCPMTDRLIEFLQKHEQAFHGLVMGSAFAVFAATFGVIIWGFETIRLGIEAAK